MKKNQKENEAEIESFLEEHKKFILYHYPMSFDEAILNYLYNLCKLSEKELYVIAELLSSPDEGYDKKKDKKLRSYIRGLRQS